MTLSTNPGVKNMRIVISGGHTTFFQNLSCHWLISAYPILSSHTDSTIFHFTKMDDQRETWPTRMKVQQRKEMLEVKLASVCDETDADVPEEVTLAKTKKKTKKQKHFTSDELSYFMTLKVQRIKRWKLIQTYEYDKLPRHRKDLLQPYHT